jgi:hypothetical protein
LPPVTDGCEAGLTWPAGMVTVAGVIETLDESLLESATVTPPVGAGVPRVIGNGAVCPGESDVLAGRPIVPGPETVTAAVVSGIKGVADT